MGLSHARHHPWFVVELRSVGLERRVGMGPSGERIVHSVVDSDCLHSLGVGARTSRHVARVEPVIVGCHIQPHHSRNIPHTFRHPEQRSRI